MLHLTTPFFINQIITPQLWIYHYLYSSVWFVYPRYTLLSHSQYGRMFFTIFNHWYHERLICAIWLNWQKTQDWRILIRWYPLVKFVLIFHFISRYTDPVKPVCREKQSIVRQFNLNIPHFDLKFSFFESFMGYLTITVK